MQALAAEYSGYAERLFKRPHGARRHSRRVIFAG
jgi:hypothetical protein